MGQHKRREPIAKMKLFGFLGGALVAGGSIRAFIYRSPMGFFGNRAFGKLLALGFLFMFAPIWSYARMQRQQGQKRLHGRARQVYNRQFVR